MNIEKAKKAVEIDSKISEYRMHQQIIANESEYIDAIRDNSIRVGTIHLGGLSETIHRQALKYINSLIDEELIKLKDELEKL